MKKESSSGLVARHIVEKLAQSGKFFTDPDIKPTFPTFERSLNQQLSLMLSKLAVIEASFSNRQATLCKQLGQLRQSTERCVKDSLDAPESGDHPTQASLTETQASSDHRRGILICQHELLKLKSTASKIASLK